MVPIHSSHLLTASSHVALMTNRSFPLGFKGSLQRSRGCGCSVTYKSSGVFTPKIFCSINMAAGQLDDSGKIKWNQLVHKAQKLWDSSPQPVKSFPWSSAFENFIQIIIDLTLVVVKCLCVPLLAVTSLSEMSYCAHERKLFYVPVPLIIGVVSAGVLMQTSLDISPLLKDAEVPWHLICIAVFFTLLKLPGPYYPYWGRIFIPHFANGGLLRTLWFVFLWYRRPQRSTRTSLSQNQ